MWVSESLFHVCRNWCSRNVLCENPEYEASLSWIASLRIFWASILGDLASKKGGKCQYLGGRGVGFLWIQGQPLYYSENLSQRQLRVEGVVWLGRRLCQERLASQAWGTKFEFDLQKSCKKKSPWRNRGGWYLEQGGQPVQPSGAGRPASPAF